MPRTKVKLAFIENYRARKSSFMKRKECLKRKLEELSILCGVDACGILYSPFEPEPEVWPEDNSMVQNVLNAFMNKSPIERSKYMVNQDSYIKERINKVNEQMSKQIMVNHEIAMDNMLSQCLSGKVSLTSLNLTHLNDLVSLAGHKLSEIEERIERVKSEATSTMQTTQSELPQSEDGVDVYVPVMEDTGNLDGMQTTGWYPPDWIGNSLEEHDFNLGPGFNMMMSIPDDPDPLWSDASFLKED